MFRRYLARPAYGEMRSGSICRPAPGISADWGFSAIAVLYLHEWQYFEIK